MKITCYKCHKQFDINENQSISRSEECPYCYEAVRCCKMCKFYDQKAYNECREPMADRIVEKEKPNFCDYYTPGNGNKSGDDKDKLLKAAESLFKKK